MLGMQGCNWLEDTTQSQRSLGFTSKVWGNELFGVAIIILLMSSRARQVLGGIPISFAVQLTSFDKKFQGHVRNGITQSRLSFLEQ